jgi:hypothetical protein
MRRSEYRDIAVENRQAQHYTRRGRAYIAVIGIDRYRAWNRLYNAVSDANGALALFVRLGFEPVGRRYSTKWPRVIHSIDSLPTIWPSSVRSDRSKWIR